MTLTSQSHTTIIKRRETVFGFTCDGVPIPFLGIRMYLGLADPDTDPLVEGMDPDPAPAPDPAPDPDPAPAPDPYFFLINFWSRLK